MMSVRKTATTARRRARRSVLLALVAVGALLMSGCYYYPTAYDHQQSDPTTRPWWCDSTGNAGGHGSEFYVGVTKGMLSWDDCKTLSAQFDVALAYAQQYPTAGSAEASGFHKIVNYVEGMGTHHVGPGGFTKEDLTSPDFDPTNPVFPGSQVDDTFNPTKPEFLMYDGNGSDARLVGMAWYVHTSTGQPPAGFPGVNDWWHVHHLLCMRTSDVLVVGEDITDAQCAARGGLNLHLDNYYMVHAWIVPGWEITGDVFRNHHPCLQASGPVTSPDDPCWDEAAMPMDMSMTMGGA
jgi:hypothetical protein